MPAIVMATFDPVYGLKEAELCNKALIRAGAETMLDSAENTKQGRLSRAIYADTRDELLRIYPANFAIRYGWIPRDSAYEFKSGLFSYAYKVEDWEPIAGTLAAGAAVITAVPAAFFLAAPQLIDRVVVGTNIPQGARIQSFDSLAGTITLDRVSTGIGASIECYIPNLKILGIADDDSALFETVGGERARRILTNVSSGVVDDVSFLNVKYVHSVADPDEFDETFKDALILRLASKMAVSLAKDSGLAGRLQGEFSAVLKASNTASSEERQVDEGEGFWSDRKVGSGPSTR